MALTFFLTCRIASGQTIQNVPKEVKRTIRIAHKMAKRTIKEARNNKNELSGDISTHVFQKFDEFELLVRKYPLIEKYPHVVAFSEPLDPLVNEAYKTSNILRWCRELMASLNYLIKKSDEMNYSQNWKTTNLEIEYAAEQFRNIITSLESINELVVNDADFQSLKVKAINVKATLDLIRNKNVIIELLNYDFENSAVQKSLYDNLKNIFSTDFPPLAIQGNDLMDNIYAILTNLDKHLIALND